MEIKIRSSLHGGWWYEGGGGCGPRLARVIGVKDTNVWNTGIMRVAAAGCVDVNFNTYHVVK